MRQTISTVLAANESLTLQGPGVVKIASSTTVTASKIAATQTVNSGVVAQSTAGAKALAATVGISSITPLVGLACVLAGMVYMTKMARDTAISK